MAVDWVLYYILFIWFLLAHLRPSLAHLYTYICKSKPDMRYCQYDYLRLICLSQPTAPRTATRIQQNTTTTQLQQLNGSEKSEIKLNMQGNIVTPRKGSLFKEARKWTRTFPILSASCLLLLLAVWLTVLASGCWWITRAKEIMVALSVCCGRKRRKI